MMDPSDFAQIAKAIRKSYELRDEARNLSLQTFTIQVVKACLIQQFAASPSFDIEAFQKACNPDSTK